MSQPTFFDLECPRCKTSYGRIAFRPDKDIAPSHRCKDGNITSLVHTNPRKQGVPG